MNPTENTGLFSFDQEPIDNEQSQSLDELLWEHDVAEDYDLWIKELQEARQGWYNREHDVEIER